MKLDARFGDLRWDVYDAKRCYVPKDVVWVNSATAEWGQYVRDDFVHIKLHGRPRIDVHREDKISIYADRRLVIFNEVDDADPVVTEIHDVVPA